MFYTPEKGYRSGNTLWFFLERSENNLIRIQKVEHSAKVFNIPHFTFEDSEQYMVSDTIQNDSKKLNQLRIINTDMCKLALSQEWLVQAYPEEKTDLATSTVKEIRFFYQPEYYDSPIEKSCLLVHGIDLNKKRQAVMNILNLVFTH